MFVPVWREEICVWSQNRINYLYKLHKDNPFPCLILLSACVARVMRDMTSAVGGADGWFLAGKAGVIVNVSKSFLTNQLMMANPPYGPCTFWTKSSGKFARPALHMDSPREVTCAFRGALDYT